ncbi:hypothetical protein B0H12DRAFT_293321 [Mycena haematopus]|nr:hypothetical protein B0H12DRAFT_293321 [Mycena haematopus]
MAELVLFYTHALLTRRSPYPRPTFPVNYRIAVPTFPASIFRLNEAFLCNGPLFYKAQLKPFHGRPIYARLSAKLCSSHGWSSHDGDIVISFGHLVSWPFKAHVVAKATNEPSAAARCRHEFEVYTFLRAIQGVCIPYLIGFHKDIDDGSSVLVTSYAGVPLEDFKTMCLADRQKLLSRAVQLHQAGVEHRDLEPRNVTLSPRSGPMIIDFDDAKINHVCPGATCSELSELARWLEIEFPSQLAPSSSSHIFRWIWVLLPFVSMLLLPLRERAVLSG